MTTLEAIDKRQSRREYLPTPINNESVRIINEKIDYCNKESGMTITFINDGSDAFGSMSKSYGMFKNVKSLIVLKGNKNLEFLKEKAGYFGELLILEATCLGLGTCWVGGTYDNESPVLGAHSDEDIVAVVPIGNINEEKGLKEKVLYKSIRRSTKDVEDFYNSDKDVPSWFIKGIKAVQAAPSAKNTQKVRFNFFQEKITVSIPDDYRFDLVDLGIAKLHFELATNISLGLGNNCTCTL